jgi:hypothetical protein
MEMIHDSLASGIQSFEHLETIRTGYVETDEFRHQRFRFTGRHAFDQLARSRSRDWRNHALIGHEILKALLPVASIGVATLCHTTRKKGCHRAASRLSSASEQKQKRQCCHREAPRLSPRRAAAARTGSEIRADQGK